MRPLALAARSLNDQGHGVHLIFPLERLAVEARLISVLLVIFLLNLQASLAQLAVLVDVCVARGEGEARELTRLIRVSRRLPHFLLHFLLKYGKVPLELLLPQFLVEKGLLRIATLAVNDIVQLLQVEIVIGRAAVGPRLLPRLLGLFVIVWVTATLYFVEGGRQLVEREVPTPIVLAAATARN